MRKRCNRVLRVKSNELKFPIETSQLWVRIRWDCRWDPECFEKIENIWSSGPGNVVAKILQKADEGPNQSAGNNGWSMPLISKTSRNLGENRSWNH